MLPNGFRILEETATFCVVEIPRWPEPTVSNMRPLLEHLETLVRAGYTPMGLVPGFPRVICRQEYSR
jgi:hypothetical protein